MPHRSEMRGARVCFAARALRLISCLLSTHGAHNSVGSLQGRTQRITRANGSSSEHTMVGSRRTTHLAGMMQPGGRCNDFDVSEPFLNTRGKALCRRRAALPSLLRNDLARHWVNRFRPELKCREVRSALLPAAAMRRPHSSGRGGPSRAARSQISMDF